MRAMPHGGLAPGSSSAGAAKQRTWVSAVSDACSDAFGDVSFPDGPLGCAIVFRFAMRKGDLIPKSTRVKANAPLFLETKPDGDKLERATWDAITAAATVWRDDAQVAVQMAARCYVVPGELIGATIFVGPAMERRELVSLWSTEIALIDERRLAAIEHARATRGRAA